MVSTDAHTVKATFYYLKEGIDEPFHRRDPLPDEQTTNIESVGREHEVTDLRGIEHLFSTDENGFAVVKDSSPEYELFNDAERIQNEYYPHIEQLVKKQTGRSKVILFDHTIRRRDPKISEDRPANRQPGRQVHVDQTPSAVERRVRRHLDQEEADRLLKGRVRLLNVWRPLFNDVTDTPLGLVDYKTTKPDELVPAKLIYPTFVGETYQVRYSPAHRWYYISHQNSDETIFIKCYDSDPSFATYTPHSAFVNPETPENARHRESIEVRALVFG